MIRIYRVGQDGGAIPDEWPRTYTCTHLVSRMTAEEGPEDETWRSTAAEGRLLLREARQRLEASRREIVALHTRLVEATSRFEELQRLVADLNKTFGLPH